MSPSDLRDPEYTGENRCLPCTIVNVAIAAVASIVVALATDRNRVLGGAVFAGSLAVIYLRGYLVPGTPALTKRYLPERVLAAFDKEPMEGRDGWESAPDERTGADDGDADDATAVDATDSDDDADDGGDTDSDDDADDDDEHEFETVERIENQRENAVDPVEFLLEVGVVVPTDGPEELTFSESFADRLDARIADLDAESVDRETLAPLFDVDPEDISFEDRSYPAVTVRRRVRKWPGEAAYLADVGAHLTLTDHTDRWEDVPVEQRLAILKSLRSFYEACPLCGDALSITDETVESCCRAYEVVAIRCETCDHNLLELDPEEVETPGADTGITA